MTEITLAHIRQLAIKFGCPVREDHGLAFLNQDGHAYGMMQAGEDFIMSNLPKVLSKGAATRSNEPAIRADFPIYPTSADAKSDLNNTLRI